MAEYTAWRAIKSTPDAEGYDVAREAFIKASEVADHREARAELDRAIRAADEAYEAELTRAWRREHRGMVQSATITYLDGALETSDVPHAVGIAAAYDDPC